MTELQALLVAVAEGDREALPVLADWLEDHGDARAEEVRKYVEFITASASREDMEDMKDFAVDLVLGQFPEAPEYRMAEEQRPVAEATFARRAQAEGLCWELNQARGHRRIPRRFRVIGPIFPTPQPA